MLKCELCHFNNPDGFAYCGRCGNGLAADVPDDNSYANAIEGERKQVTIIFADISGFTALNDSAETPAQVERVLYVVNRCLDMLSDIVYEYDGYVDKYMGDAIMAVFGAPRSHEDDPERALHAALAMQEKLIEFNAHPPAPLIEKLGIDVVTPGQRPSQDRDIPARDVTRGRSAAVTGNPSTINLMPLPS
jgi:class 3 adenylate cyclase